MDRERLRGPFALGEYFAGRAAHHDRREPLRQVDAGREADGKQLHVDAGREPDREQLRARAGLAPACVNPGERAPPPDR